MERAASVLYVTFVFALVAAASASIGSLYWLTGVMTVLVLIVLYALVSLVSFHRAWTDVLKCLLSGGAYGAIAFVLTASTIVAGAAALGAIIGSSAVFLANPKS